MNKYEFITFLYEINKYRYRKNLIYRYPIKDVLFVTLKLNY
jgi:hypothetical protein